MLLKYLLLITLTIPCFGPVEIPLRVKDKQGCVELMNQINSLVADPENETEGVPEGSLGVKATCEDRFPNQ